MSFLRKVQKRGDHETTLRRGVVRRIFRVSWLRIEMHKQLRCRIRVVQKCMQDCAHHPAVERHGTCTRHLQRSNQQIHCMLAASTKSAAAAQPSAREAVTK